MASARVRTSLQPMHALFERALGLGPRAITRLPSPLLRLLAGRPVTVDGQTLSPEVQLALRLERLQGGWKPLPVAEARALRRRDARIFAGPRFEVAAVEALEVPGPAGPLAARLYVPHGAGGADAPLVVYFHGGGHVICDLDTHDQPCRLLARESGARLLAVGYRLGPEHRFPAAVEDAFAAFRWARENAPRIGVDPARVAVAGDSAGGNLATVVCRVCGDENEPVPAHQVLIYPLIDFSRKRRSYELFGDGFFLTEGEMDWFRDHYLRSEADREDPRASPILAPDLTAQPPALVVTAGFDPLRDEGEAYAARLREAGVPVTHRREPDLIHGFINAAGIGGRSHEATRAIATWIGARFAEGTHGRAGSERVEGA